jgi:sugar/nucleoside kinase (ribokinase family)
MPKYFIIGSTFVDINSIISQSNGSISISSDYNIGGKGFNVVKGLGVLGTKTVFHSYLGNDIFVDEVRTTLHKYGIEIAPESYVSGASTPIASVINGEGKVLFEKVDTSVFQNFPLPKIQESTTDILIFSHLPDETVDIVKRFKETRGATIYLSIAGSKDVTRVISMLDFVDVIFANRKETATLLELAQCDSVEELINKFNIREFISTQDADGAYVYVGSEDGIQSHHIPNYNGYTEPIINTVGAGDAVVASFLHFRSILSSEKSLEKALKICAFHIRNKYSSLTEIPENI